MTALDLLVGLEAMLPEPVRGRCPRCGNFARLTEKGYLGSHCYFSYQGEDGLLSSWTALAESEGQPSRVIIRCSGGGNRPSRRAS